MIAALLACAAVAAGAYAGLAGGAANASAKRSAPARTPSAADHSTSATAGSGAGHAASTRATTAAQRPNIVFVLTDDLSMDLVRFMPHVQELEARGMTFDNYFASDSLCCPSRASIFTGNFPHDTGVFGNVGPSGGVGAFLAQHDEQDTFNLALQRSGYVTAMMGKYLNGYLQGPSRSPVPPTYVPPGWNEWDVAGWGYPEYNYLLNENGTLRRFGNRPQDYLTNVLARKGVRFIDRVARSRQPFFLELATFAPHSPYTPARRDVRDFPALTAPRPPSFDTLPTDPPMWLAGHAPLTSGKIRRIDRAFRRRAQAVQAIDDMIGRIESGLAARGMIRNTYIVFSSDNGLHMGEYRLMPGKLTAFDTDIHVPLVVAGPGVPSGQATDAIASNIDLAKTFTALGGTAIADDGHSLVPLLRGFSPPGWRNTALIEHRGPDVNVTDPDFQAGSSGNPTTYEAMRTARFLYVEYDDGEQEFYDLRTDPDELHNIAGTLTTAQLDRLHDELDALENCHSGDECWAAAHVAPRP